MEDELVRAVKKLRRRLEESQQAFATRLGLSIRTVANYEAGRRPSGKPLLALERAATLSGSADLANAFRDALSVELEAWEELQLLIIPATKASAAHGHLMLKLDGEKELRGAQDFMSVISALGSPALRDEAVAALESLRKAAQKLNGNPLADQVAEVVSRIHMPRKGAK